MKILTKEEGMVEKLKKKQHVISKANPDRILLLVTLGSCIPSSRHEIKTSPQNVTQLGALHFEIETE